MIYRRQWYSVEKYKVLVKLRILHYVIKLVLVIVLLYLAALSFKHIWIHNMFSFVCISVV